MAFTSCQLFLAVLMLIAGTFNTISIKWANMQVAHFCNKSENATQYHHPAIQTLGMFIGELFCLLAFRFIWLTTIYYRRHHVRYNSDTSSDVHVIDGGEQHYNVLIFLIPALFDMASASLNNFALHYINAGTYQMLRGSVMIFTALFSMLFLRKRITLIQWIGIFTVIIGLVIVGLVTTLSGNHNNNSTATTAQQVLAVIFLIFAAIITGLHMVYQECFISRYNIPPLKVVGWEGLFGLICLSFLLIPLNYIKWSESDASPDHRLEHLPSAFCQMADNHNIILATIANIISVAFYNYTGVAVTKELSSTTRVVIDNGRIVLVYIVSVTIFKATFHLLDVLGLILLILGVGIYNGLWTHLYHRVIQSKQTATVEERTTLISDSNEISTYS